MKNSMLMLAVALIVPDVLDHRPGSRARLMRKSRPLSLSPIR